jgi:hypothetical protein
VNQSRLRSLAISLGILLLMGVAVVVLLVSSYRAQRLAEQQIALWPVCRMNCGTVAVMRRRVKTSLTVL